jgi:YfiH family protein
VNRSRKNREVPLGDRDLAFRLGEAGTGGGWRHAFSTRHGGLPPGDREAGWRPFLEAGGFPLTARVAKLRQVHGNRVHVYAAAAPLPDSPPEADGAVTRDPGLVLTVRTADCLPVLMADPAAGVVGVAHAGWRGVVAGVLQRTVDSMERLGARARAIQVAVGPGIGACCFEVGEEVARAFANLGPGLVLRTGGRPRADLAGAVLSRLRLAGVPVGSILKSEHCTRCRTDLFFSHRGEPGGTGRLLSAAALDEPRSEIPFRRSSAEKSMPDSG